MSLCLVADDLTGALDSAVQFTGHDNSVLVLLPGARAPDDASVAFDLNCRDGDEDTAVRRVRACADRLTAADLAFKKIDSLLRGHWAAELAALVATQFFDRVVIAPAFPAQGRATRGGQQFMRVAEGGWHAVPVDVAGLLAQHGLAPVPLGSQRFSVAPTATRIHLCDAETDQNLAQIASTARSLGGRTLWCGSAGLARALAARPPRPVAPSGKPHLVVVGSNHAVSRGQIDWVRRTHAAGFALFGADPAVSAIAIEACLAERGYCIALADVQDGTDAATASGWIADWLRGTMPRLPQPGLLTVVGGETFAGLCRALNATVLDVCGEWRPGLPMSRFRDGLWAGLDCLSKSGAFGGKDLFADLLGAPVDVTC